MVYWFAVIGFKSLQTMHPEGSCDTLLQVRPTPTAHTTPHHTLAAHITHITHTAHTAYTHTHIPFTPLLQCVMSYLVGGLAGDGLELEEFDTPQSAWEGLFAWTLLLYQQVCCQPEVDL